MPPLRERGNDIPLLFRKFAADIAEQYTIDPVYLSEEAKEYICRYKWPGNIRELKNKVEQLSFLATEREISVEALKQVEVQDDSMNGSSLVLARDINASTSQHLYENEREMLLKQLFTLSNEIKELKEIVKEEHKHKQMERVRDDESMQYISFAAPKPQPKVERLAEPLLDDIETAEAYVEEAPLSIKERYEQSIIDALRRNNNNKRKAAQELGISERTLYRKIKEMGLNK
jgi:DNA-binding NtrC family response regulator